MAYRFRSRDGLAQSNDQATIATWDSIGERMAREQSDASEALRELGVRLEHPDDGWVDRERNTVRPCYPRFDLGVAPGDLIALGDPWNGYRVVRCTSAGEVGVIARAMEYGFVDEGQRWP